MKFAVSFMIILISSCAIEKNNPSIAPKITPSLADAENQNRKIIYEATLTLLCKNLDTTFNFIDGLAKTNKGYIYESNTNLVCLRVKSDSLNTVIRSLSSSGKIIAKTLKSKDVTEEFTDYAIRLENAERTRNRYLELLTKAENVQATLAVEKELERVNENIELLKGKMNKINQLESFATVKIYLKVAKKPGIIGYVGIGIYKSIKWLFVRN